MSRFVLLLAASAMLAVAVNASLPACTDSLPDVDGHYVYSASPAAYISSSDSPNLATQDFTASMWVNPSARVASGLIPLFGQGPDSGCGAGGPACYSNLFIGYEFDSVTTHYTMKLSASYDGNANVVYNAVSVIAPADADIGNWQLYVFTYDHLAFKFAVWRNGQPLVLSAGGVLTQAYQGPAAVVCIGCAGGGTGSNIKTFFVGSIDEVRLWYGMILAPSDISTLWCSNVVATAAANYMNGGDFLSNGGTAQTVSTPAPALTHADVTNECYGSCTLQSCASLPCQNGGTCAYPPSSFNATTNVTTTQSDTFSCVCAAGFSGAFCQTDINECASAPCLNGATCVDDIARFNCSCAAGYTGALCQTDINECASSPCQNGGLCVDLVNAFFCNCTQPPMPDCSACANPIPLVSDLGGQTLAPGCYIPTAAEPFANSGTVTLSGSGRYQFASAQPMSTNANSIIQLQNGADCRRVSWCMTGAITLGANSFFIGSMHSTSGITIGGTVVVQGAIVSDTTINYGTADSISACPNAGNVFHGAFCQFVNSTVAAASSSAGDAPSSSAAAAPHSSSAAAAAAVSSSAGVAPVSSSAGVAPVSSSAAAAAAVSSSAGVAPGASSSGASHLSSSAAAVVVPASSSAAAAAGASPSSSASSIIVPPVSSSAAAAPGAGPSSSGVAAPSAPSSSAAAAPGACAVNPCLHGGLCTAVGASASCNCTVAIAPNCGCINPVVLSSGELSGRTLAPGCYVPDLNAVGALTLNGDLHLAGAGPFTFVTHAALTSAALSQVLLSAGAQCQTINWCIGGAVTLGASSAFAGNVQTDVSGAITVGASADVAGSLHSGAAVVTIGASALVVDCPNPNAAGNLSPVITANHYSGATCEIAPPIVMPLAAVPSSTGATSTGAAAPISSAASASSAASSLLALVLVTVTLAIRRY